MTFVTDTFGTMINLLSNCQETIIYYPGFSETEGNGLVFIGDVYE